MLRWLLRRETVDTHLSPTPVGGAGPGDSAPAFDQQPIEVAAMADACHRAYSVTGDAEWLTGLDMAARWFAGDNDAAATDVGPRDERWLRRPSRLGPQSQPGSRVHACAGVHPATGPASELNGQLICGLTA